MKFQDDISNMNTYTQTHTHTDKPKPICPPLFQSWGHNKQSYKDEMASHMESYFNDQRLRQANKSQSEVRSISNDSSLKHSN